MILNKVERVVATNFPYVVRVGALDGTERNTSFYLLVYLLRISGLCDRRKRRSHEHSTFPPKLPLVCHCGESTFYIYVNVALSKGCLGSLA